MRIYYTIKNFIAWTTLAAVFSVSFVGPVQSSTEHGGVKLKTRVPKLDVVPPQRKLAILQGRAEHHHVPAQICGNQYSRPKLLAMSRVVDSSVPLKASVVSLADGTRLEALHDEALFDSEPKRLIPGSATVNLTDGYVKDTLLKAFAQMDCLEFASVGANNRTAPEVYRSLSYGGRKIAVGASRSMSNSPMLHLTVGGRPMAVVMTLPGLLNSSQNVVVVTDGEHVLAIDPQSGDSWELKVQHASTSRTSKWLKLTHSRGRISSPEPEA